MALGATWTLTIVRRDYQVITAVREDPRNTTREEADAAADGKAPKKEEVAPEVVVDDEGAYAEDEADD